MSNNNRFHNKYHRHNHHTDATAGEIDSSHDPIASESDPFKGDFHMDGNIHLSGDAILSTGQTLSSDNIHVETAHIDALSGLNSSTISMGAGITLDFDGAWVDNLDVGKLTGVSITEPVSANEYLLYNGVDWENSELYIPPDAVGLHQLDLDIIGNGLEVQGNTIATTSNVPLGTVIMYMLDGVPDSTWVECSGQTVTNTDYPDLYARLGRKYGGQLNGGVQEFVIPDMRGMFVRGRNNGRSDGFSDPDEGSRTAPNEGGATSTGSTQTDEVGPHNHTYIECKLNSKATTGMGSSKGANDVWVARDTSTNSGDESRPNNIYVTYIMKAKF